MLRPRHERSFEEGGERTGEDGGTKPERDGTVRARSGPWLALTVLMVMATGGCDSRELGVRRHGVPGVFEPVATGAPDRPPAARLARARELPAVPSASEPLRVAELEATGIEGTPEPALPPKFGRALARIAIDPGHGGSDPGAVGLAGTTEKEVTLDVARRAKPLLAREGIAVLLTREDDRSVPLEERTALANAFGADVFVSLHCNATENRLQHGVQTYVLDTARGAMTNRIAARENAADPRGGAELASLLASMRMADQATRSTHLADLLQRAEIASLREGYPGIVDRGVQAAGFHVLAAARMPAVLFEMSFLSHARDEERLGTEEYRGRLADGIVNAVRAYREGR